MSDSWETRARDWEHMARALAAQLEIAWLGEPGVPARFSNRLHGPTHNCDPERCMIDQCPRVREVLSDIPDLPEEAPKLGETPAEHYRRLSSE